MKRPSMPLKDGDRVAIVGGGPAGSLFAHFARQLALQKGLALDITIFDGKDFHKTGPPGCNMCAGVLAASFIKEMADSGIPLPPEVVQRYIQGYSIETPVGHLDLHPPEGTGPICTIYRGGGPRGSNPSDDASFDDYLLEHVKAEGTRVVTRYVQDIVLPPDPDQPARLQLMGQAGAGETHEAELVVGAFGLNTWLTRKTSPLGFGYRPPEALASVQAEVWLGADQIKEAWGNHIYVYELGLPGARFVAITPKRDFLTVSMIGRALTEKDIPALFSHPVVRRRLPEGWELPSSFCHCRPHVADSPCRQPYTDRLVVVGDASTSRLYKNGLESSFVTARAAAEAAVNHGVSADAFREHYYPTCRALARDALYGRLLFFLHDRIFRRPRLTSAFLEAAAADNGSKGSRQLRRLGWSMLTGDRPYKDVLREMIAVSPYWSLAQAAFVSTKNGPA